MKTDARYVKVGQEFAPLTFTVTPELNQQYLFAAEDFHPRYLDDGQGIALVHPGLLLNMSNNTKSPSFHLPRGWAEIHAAEETQFSKPALVGDPLTVTWVVSNAEMKRDRLWHTVDIEIRDSAGDVILTRQMTNTFANSNCGDAK